MSSVQHEGTEAPTKGAGWICDNCGTSGAGAVPLRCYDCGETEDLKQFEDRELLAVAVQLCRALEEARDAAADTPALGSSQEWTAIIERATAALNAARALHLDDDAGRDA